MPTQSHRLFPPFRLDPANAQLWRGEEQIALRPKTFEVLRYLVDRPGQLVTKLELLDGVWTEVAVSDSLPAVCVKELRKALGDNARTPRFIETVHRRGYRFIAKVTTAEGREASRVPPAMPKERKPILVGRNQDLERLKSWYSQVLEGQRRVVFIAGEVGIGKSAFAQTFLDSIAEDASTRVACGQCVEQYGAGEPYMPVLEGLTRLGQASDGERVVEILRRLAPTWLAQMPGLFIRDERHQLPSEVPGVTQHRMLRELTQALEALAAESPLVLVLEDLHWSDFSTLELISAVGRRVEAAQLMILGTYRPVEMLVNDHPLRTMKEELELHRYCEELRLKLLKETDIAAYLAQRFSSGDSQRYARFAPVIHARTDGNPLFMISVVDYLVDEGIVTNSRELRATDILISERLEAPRSIRQMIERNFERLKPDEQAVLEIASVAGAEFSAASVAAALDRPQDEIEACCTRLSRHEQFVSTQGPVTWPDGTIAAGFRFNHALYQEVLYGRLPVGHRLQLHRRIAAREEAGYGERSGEVATELAHHYSLANVKNKAVHYFRVAGEQAAARGAVVEAEDHYRRALKWLAELPQTIELDRLELVVQMALADVLWSSKSWAHRDASNAYERAQELAAKLGETSKLEEASLGLIVSALGSGHFKRARELGQRALTTAEHSADRSKLCSAHALLGQALLWRAEYVDAQKHLEWASAHYQEGDRGEWGLDACGLLPIALLTLGYADRARTLMKEALGRAGRCADPLRLGAVHMWGGFFFDLLRDARLIIEQVHALETVASKHPVFSGASNLFMGKALMIQGNLGEGTSYLRKAIAFTDAIGWLGLQTFEKLDETEFFASEGQVDKALALTAEAIAYTEEFAHLRSPALRRRAEVLAQSGTAASAVETAYRQAIETARVQGAKYHELRATTSFACWLQSHGRASEALRVLADIYHWFTEGFDTPALKEAKALLDELSDESGAIPSSSS